MIIVCVSFLCMNCPSAFDSESSDMANTPVMSCISIALLLLFIEIVSDVLSASWSHLTGPSRSRSRLPVHARPSRAHTTRSYALNGLMLISLTMSRAAALGAASCAAPPLCSLTALPSSPMFLIPACRTAPELPATSSAHSTNFIIYRVGAYGLNRTSVAVLPDHSSMPACILRDGPAKPCVHFVRMLSTHCNNTASSTGIALRMRRLLFHNHTTVCTCLSHASSHTGAMMIYT